MAQLKSGSQMGGSAVATTQQIPAGGVPTGQTYQMGVGGIAYMARAANPGQRYNTALNATANSPTLSVVNAGSWRLIGGSANVTYSPGQDSPPQFSTGSGLWVRVS